MALTIAQLTAAFTNANAGTAPTTAQLSGLQAIANQNATNVLTDTQANQAAIDLGSDTTTAVSVQTYQFFLGFAPSQAGLAALNAAYVGSGAQAGMNGENRYIAQSVSLALQNPTAKANFAAGYGAGTIADATKAAYNTIVGNAAAAAAGINVDAAVAFLTSSASIAYYTAFVKANVPGLAAADVDLAVRAALVGEIIYQATIYNNGAGVGSYATAANNLMLDLADDGALKANNAAGIDLFANYGVSPVAKNYTLTVSADSFTAGGGDDTFNAFTVDANGANATTLTQFDTIDGGLGTDTLNIYTDDGPPSKNMAVPANTTIKNIEIINVYNANTAGAFGDASAYAGVTQLNQIGANAAAVSNLAATTTAGFSGTTGGATVAPAAGVATAKIALTNFAESTALTVNGGAATSTLNSVTVTGSVKDSNADGSVAAIALGVTTGKNVTSLAVNSAVKANLTVTNNGSNDVGVAVTTVDASGSTGAIGYNAATGVTTITTGSGSDNVQINTATVLDNPGTSADETVSASLTTGAGNDTIAINTSGTGKTTVSAGEGNDGITINTRGGAAAGNTLTITGGAGDDTVTMTAANSIVYSSSSSGLRDSVDGGDGTDTLAFSAAVGTAVSADVNFNKAISNFEKISVAAVGNTENATIDLANLDDISYVVSAGSSAAAGVTESAVVTFTQLLSGQSVTVGDKTYTNNTGATQSANAVASAFAAAYDVTGYTDTQAGVAANQVKFTSTTATTNVTPDLSTTLAVANSAAPTNPSFSSYQQGITTQTGTAEVQTVTFQGLIAGEQVNVGGRVVTATAITETATATFTGGLTAGQTASFGGRTVTATGATEVATVTLNANYADTASAVVNGVTVTNGTGGSVTGAQMAAVLAGGTIAGITLSGTSTVAGYTVANPSGAIVTLTYGTPNVNATDISASSVASVSISQGNTGAVTANEVAAALRTGSNTGNGVVTGTLDSNYSAGGTGASVVLTSNFAATNVVNIAAPTGSATNTFTVVDGNNGNLTAGQVAAAFGANASSGAAVVSGTLTGFTSAAASGNTVAITGTAVGNVGPVAISTTAGTAPTVTSVDGTPAVAGQTEIGILTFTALKDGQSVTVDGRTVTANGVDLSASQVANIFATGSGAGGTVTGALSGNWTITNPDNTDALVTFTSVSTNTSVTDLGAGTAAAAAAPAAVTATTTQGAPSYGNLNINNLAANGTVEFTDVTAGTTTVALKDATGTADVVNLKLNGAANIVNTGSVVVAGVETVNITTADSTVLTDPAAASVIRLTAADATKVTVSGNHGVDFTGSVLANVTTMDASGVVLGGNASASAASAVTFASAVTGSTKVVTITGGAGDDTLSLNVGNTKGGTISGGAGNDTITGSGGTDTINAGDGNDLVRSSAGADVVTLGAGKDAFKLMASTHSVLATAQTITDFSANTVAQSTSSKGGDANVVLRNGDVIDVASVLGGGVTGIKVLVATNAADAQTIIQNISTNDGTLTGFVLDSSTGKLYMDFNDDGNIDSVITLTGVTTLTTAGFLTGL